jgi:hypothetical protein
MTPDVEEIQSENQLQGKQFPKMEWEYTASDILYPFSRMSAEGIPEEFTRETKTLGPQAARVWQATRRTSRASVCSVHPARRDSTRATRAARRVALVSLPPTRAHSRARPAARAARRWRSARQSVFARLAGASTTKRRAVASVPSTRSRRRRATTSASHVRQVRWLCLGPQAINMIAHFWFYSRRLCESIRRYLAGTEQSQQASLALLRSILQEFEVDPQAAPPDAPAPGTVAVNPVLRAAPPPMMVALDSYADACMYFAPNRRETAYIRRHKL